MEKYNKKYQSGSWWAIFYGGRELVFGIRSEKETQELVHSLNKK